MATDTEPPPAAPQPPWRQELLLRRRRDGRVVTPARPTPPPPPPTPAARGGGGASPDPELRPPISRYIDAFGEIVGLPSPRGTCEGPCLTPSHPDADDLQYGPGIVSRLRSRYLSMAQREAAGGGSDAALRRAASLQDLLRREGAFERGALQDSYLLTGRATLTTPAAWGDSIRKAKSVGDLVSPPPAPAPRPRPTDQSDRPPQPDSGVRRRELTEGRRSEGRSVDKQTAAVRSGGACQKIARPGGACDQAVTSAGASEKTSAGKWGENIPAVKSGEKIVPAPVKPCEKTVPTPVKPGKKTTLVKSAEASEKVVRPGGSCEKSLMSRDVSEQTVTSKGEKTTPLGSGSGCKKKLERVAPQAGRSDKSNVTEGRSATAGDGPITPGPGSVAGGRSVSPVAAMKDSGGPQVVPQPLRDSRLIRKNSMPAIDTVSTVKRLFEPGAAGGGGGGGGPSRDAVQPEKGGALDGGGVWPAAPDAPLAAGRDDVTSVPARLMVASDAAGSREDAEMESPGQPSPPPARRQVGVIRPSQTPPPDDREVLERRHNKLNHARNGHPPAGRSAVNGQAGTPPLRAKNMVGMLLNRSHASRRGDRTIITGPVTKGAPMTKASLAAAVKRSSPPVLAADPGRLASVQAVNARLLSAASEDKSSGPGEPPPATDGLSQPSAPPAAAPMNQTIAWHQQVNNSTRFNFTDRSNVPDYIEDDGMDIHRPAKPKPNDTAYVLLPGFEPGQTSDEDLVVTLVQPVEPPVCSVTFSNAGIIINGHSSLQRQPREGTRSVWFSEVSPRVFRYPSEASLRATEPAPRHTDSTSDEEDEDGSESNSNHPAPFPRLADPAPSANANAKPSTLSNYTSSRLASEEAAAFQLGVTRTSRPPPPSAPAPAPPTAPAPAPDQPEEDAAWSAEATADMLF